MTELVVAGDGQHPSSPIENGRGSLAGNGGLAADIGQPRRLPGRPRRLALIGGRPLRRAAVLALLSRSARDFEARGFPDPDQVLASSLPFDLIVLDVADVPMIDPSVRDTLLLLGQQFDGVPLVVLSDREDADSVAAVFRSGASGLISTCLEPEVVVEALRLIHAGGKFYPSAALVQAFDERPPALAAPPPSPLASAAANRLTERQRAVLSLLQKGKSNKVIARELGMSESTVKVHVRHIMRKLHAANRTEAALLGRQHDDGEA